MYNFKNIFMKYTSLLFSMLSLLLLSSCKEKREMLTEGKYQVASINFKDGTSYEKMSEYINSLKEFEVKGNSFILSPDSSVMYTSRLKELEEQQGPFSFIEAAKVYAAALQHQGIDNALELTYYERLRVHNLKYYTWVEQQGKTYDELNRQWYDREYWKSIPKMLDEIDELIIEFNKMITG